MSDTTTSSELIPMFSKFPPAEVDWFKKLEEKLEKGLEERLTKRLGLAPKNDEHNFKDMYDTLTIKHNELKRKYEDCINYSRDLKKKIRDLLQEEGEENVSTSTSVVTTTSNLITCNVSANEIHLIHEIFSKNIIPDNYEFKELTINFDPREVQYSKIGTKKCSCCGKGIKKGDLVYKYIGCTYNCHSHHIECAVYICTYFPNNPCAGNYNKTSLRSCKSIKLNGVLEENPKLDSST